MSKKPDTYHVTYGKSKDSWKVISGNTRQINTRKTTKKWKSQISTLILLFLSILVIFIYFYHLEADPDTILTWSGDFYTDESWHTENSISRYMTGGWIIPGSANHILLMPVMPLINYIFMKVFGLSLWVLRVPAVIFCLLSITIVWAFAIKRIKRDDNYLELYGNVIPILCLFIIGFNYYFFIYGRLAFLDIPMAAFGLSSMFFVYRAIHAEDLRHRKVFYIFGGIFLGLSLLTKTTAVIFVLTLIFVLALQFLTNKTSRKPIFLGIASVIIIGLLVYPVVYKSLPYLLSAGDVARPTELISAKIHYNPLLFLNNLNRVFLNPLILQNQILFYLAAMSMLLVVLQSYRQGKVEPADNIMLSLFVASCLFFGYFSYQPTRYFTIFIIPIAYFVSMLPINLLTISQMSSDKHKAKRVMLTAVIIIACVNIPNVLQVVTYHANPNYSIVVVANRIKEDIVRDSRIWNVDDIKLVSNLSIFSAVNKIKPLYEIPSVSLGPTYCLSLGEISDTKGMKAPSLSSLSGKGLVPVARYNLLNNYYGRRRLYLYRMME